MNKFKDGIKEVIGTALLDAMFGVGLLTPHHGFAWVGFWCIWLALLCAGIILITLHALPDEEWKDAKWQSLLKMRSGWASRLVILHNYGLAIFLVWHDWTGTGLLISLSMGLGALIRSRKLEIKAVLAKTPPTPGVVDAEFTVVHRS